ncbi:MAG: amylo-alpha-1,6-glucosidase [Gemmatimonadota bacterium]
MTTQIQHAPQPESTEVERFVTREWLVTNGLGGYASGTVSGIITRRHHGLLIAALPAPLGRTLMLNHLSEELRFEDGRAIELGGEELVGPVLQFHGAEHLREFRLERGLPVWIYAVDDNIIEKRVLMPHARNTVLVSYRLVQGGAGVEMRLRPALHFRSHEAPVSTPLLHEYSLAADGGRFEVRAEGILPPLRLSLTGGDSDFIFDEKHIIEMLYRVEQARGYDSVGSLWSPGTFQAFLTTAEPVVFTASVESWQLIEDLRMDNAREFEATRRSSLLALAPAARADAVVEQLVLAADQFIIIPAARAEETARAQAAGEDARTIIAGYHWFTDWGRDTMISLEGLTLATGRYREAGYILRTFGHHIRDGLIPNMFPDGRTEGLYHTADATLWFFHAIDRYLDHTQEEAMRKLMLPRLLDIVEHHERGTDFGIGVDAADGLLVQGAPNYALTWMDAKCDDWVVTPRRGKAVEINALWYNALCVLEKLLRQAGDQAHAHEIAQRAARVKISFNRRFWYREGSYLYDVVDGDSGDDPACRPNQVFAISLPHPVLDNARWQAVADVVEKKLLTPFGLRSLAPDHPDYQTNYHGDLRTRDGAYHEGTVWGWLIGPFVDMWIKLYPERRREARAFLLGLVDHLDDFGVGSVAEIFDAEPPHRPRGCIAQAWSVAELLRVWQATG